MIGGGRSNHGGESSCEARVSSMFVEDMSGDVQRNDNKCVTRVSPCLSIFIIVAASAGIWRRSMLECAVLCCAGNADDVIPAEAK